MDSCSLEERTVIIHQDKSYEWIVPDPDTLTEYNLYYGYVCPVCGHPTGRHVIGEEGFGGKCKCMVDEYRHVVKPFDIRTIMNPYPESVMTCDTEVVKCPCALDICSPEFQVFHERHMEYCHEAMRRRLMRMCGTDL